MIALVPKMQQVLAEIEAERGGVALFALFERADSAGKWDVVVAAPWVRPSEKDAREYVIRKIRPKLTVFELLALSRVIVLMPEEPFVQFILGAVTPTGGLKEFDEFSFDGMEIAHAYILRSDAPLLPAVFDPDAMMEENAKFLEEMHTATERPPAGPAPPRRGRRIRSK